MEHLVLTKRREDFLERFFGTNGGCRMQERSPKIERMTGWKNNHLGVPEALENGL